MLLVTAKSVVAQPTIEQVNQALDIADQAASHGMVDLSMDAMVRALRSGPPTVSAAQPTFTLKLQNARVDTSRPFPLTARQAVDIRLRETMFRLSHQWNQTASATAVYKTLSQIVLPEDRSSEVFWYAFPMRIDPLQPDRLPSTNSVGSLLIKWARKAQTVRQLQATLVDRDAARSMAGSLLSILCSLELQDGVAIEKLNQAITKQFNRGVDRATAEITASVGKAFYQDGRHPTVAANLLELAGNAIQRIDGVQQTPDSPGSAITLAAARCRFSAGETQQGVKQLKQYLRYMPKANSTASRLNRRTDVVGSELFSRGLVAEAREILGDEVAKVFERRYQMFDAINSPQIAVPSADSRGKQVTITPASAIESTNEVARQIWVCQLDLETSSSKILFTLPDFQHTDSPSVSPDGTTLAFDATFPGEAITSGGQIYVADLDGSGLKQLTKGCSPSWSPAGKRIAYSAYQPTQGVWIMRSSGEDARLIDRFGWSGQWSPNGRMLAYTKLQNGVWDIMIFDIVENEFFSAFGKERCPFTQISADFSWSPDSSSLLFKATRSRDPNSSVAELVTLPVLSDAMKTIAIVNYGLGEDIAWSSTGNVSAIIKTSQSQPEQLFTANPTASNADTAAAKLAAIPGQFKNRRNVGSSWMPDGQSLIYISKPLRK